MVEVRFDTDSLSSVRFAVSPLFETTLSITALSAPASAAVHLPWLEQARDRTAGLDLGVMHLLMRPNIYAPDFINPLPTGPTAELDEELATMLAVPASQIRAEVQHTYANRPLPTELEPFIKRPRDAIRRLAKLLREYFDLALAEHWPRIKSLLEDDILYRARKITDAGTRALFSDLDPSISWKDEGVLRVDKRDCNLSELHLDERGLLLLPSAFAWPRVLVVSAEPWQPTVIYPARGVGMLWAPEQPVTPDSLARLLGGSRASILTALDCPRSTTELARILELTPGGVSQHLAVLHSAGLVCRRRDQRSVLYLRSESGDALMQPALADTT
jgi:DNA-binding transcriptional ArsR family regulator